MQIAFYPAAFGAAFVLLQFTTWWPPAAVVVRPLIILMLATIAIQVIASLLLGRDRGAFATVVIILATLDPSVLVLPLAVANASVLRDFRVTRQLAKVNWQSLTPTLNVVGSLLVVLSVVGIGFASVGLPGVEPRDAPATSASADAPDIYLVLLDGYPRADTLEAALDLDNQPFLNEMRSLGFQVATQAHSNYNRTILTVPSVLNAGQLNDLITNPPGGKVEEQRSLSALANRASAVRDAQSLGYSFIHVPTSPMVFTPANVGQLVDGGELTLFEARLLSKGPLSATFGAAMVTWFRDQQRARILHGFDAIEQIAMSESPRPRLVFGHFQVPHHPLVFSSDGSLPPMQQCGWGECDIPEPVPDQLRHALRGQIEYTNSRVVALARQIRAESRRPSVVVFFSDHGFRHWMSDKAETFRSLLLYSAPGHENLFPDDASPVNVIPRILNAYLNAGLPLAREDVWFLESEDQASYFPLRQLPGEPAP